MREAGSEIARLKQQAPAHRYVAVLANIEVGCIPSVTFDPKIAAAVATRKPTFIPATLGPAALRWLNRWACWAGDKLLRLTAGER